MKEKLACLLENYKYYAWVLLALIVIYLILINVDLPKLTEINSKRQDLVGIQERLSKLSAKSRLLANLDESKLNADSQKVNLVLPETKDAYSILRNIEVSASLSAVLIDDYDLVPGKLVMATMTSNLSNEIPLKIDVSSSISEITIFLEKITNIGRAMGLKNLEIEFKEGSASGKTKLELVAYFFLPGEALTKVKKIDASLSAWSSKENETLAKIYQREMFPSSFLDISSGKTDLFK